MLVFFLKEVESALLVLQAKLPDQGEEAWQRLAYSITGVQRLQVWGRGGGLMFNLVCIAAECSLQFTDLLPGRRQIFFDHYLLAYYRAASNT